MRTPVLGVLALLVVFAGCGGAPPTPPADLVLTGGTVHTFDASRSRAGALAIRGGRVVAVGTTASDLAGKLADLIVLDRNPFEVPSSQIHAIRVLWTLLEGREVFRADGFAP